MSSGKGNDGGGWAAERAKLVERVNELEERAEFLGKEIENARVAVASLVGAAEALKEARMMSAWLMLPKSTAGKLEAVIQAAKELAPPPTE